MSQESAPTTAFVFPHFAGAAVEKSVQARGQAVPSWGDELKWEQRQPQRPVIDHHAPGSRPTRKADRCQYKDDEGVWQPVGALVESSAQVDGQGEPDLDDD